MKTKHTPGPWEIGSTFVSDDKNAISITSPTRNVIFHQWNHGETELSAVDQANARLIAAAPELLSALKIVTQLPGYEAEEPYAEQIRAAIAKAEGTE